MAAAETTDLTSNAIRVDMEATIAQSATRYLDETGEQPSLAIIADNYVEATPTQRYIDLKMAKGAELGISVRKEICRNVSGWVRYFNSDPTTHGLIVQLPVQGFERDTPEARFEKTETIVAQIDYDKDVDDLTGISEFTPATPLAIVSLLNSNNIDLQQPIRIRGLGRLVGRPLFDLLAIEGARDVVGFDADTPEKEKAERLDEARILITATGRPHSLTPGMFREGTEPKIVIDAGAAEQSGKLVSDVSPELREWGKERGWIFSAKNGGVGPLTVLHLLENVVQAAWSQHLNPVPSFPRPEPDRPRNGLVDQWWRGSSERVTY